MLHKSVRLWQVCHTADLTKLFIQTIHCRPHFVKLVIIRAVRIGLFLMLKCRQIWIFSNIFWDSSFTSSLPNTSIQRSWTLEGEVKEPIIQIPWNFWVPYTVPFIVLFGYIWLLYKFVSSAILASSSSVRKNVLEKVMGSTDLQNFFLAISYFPWIWRQILKIMSPPLHFHLLQNGFLHFPDVPPALHDASYVLGTAEDQAFQMSSTVIWNMVIFYKFIVCRQSKFLFSDGKSLLILPLFLLQIQNNTESLYVEQQEFHSLLYSPHHYHQCPRHQRAMIFCDVIFLPGPLSNENETFHISPCFQLYQPTRCSNFSSLLLVV